MLSSRKKKLIINIHIIMKKKTLKIRISLIITCNNKFQYKNGSNRNKINNIVSTNDKDFLSEIHNIYIQKKKEIKY